MFLLLLLFHFHFRRLGEYNKEISQDEKYSNRLRMVRKKHTRRASKYSLEKQTDLTHFGKRIADMPKSELRQAYIGSGDERDDEPFSYDELIAKSKEHRAAARRQKMEAEAELEDLDDQFGGVWKSLSRRDMGRADVVEDEDDLAFIARSFQMENIRKAAAGERNQTPAEIAEAHNVLVRKSEVDKATAERSNQVQDDDDEEVDDDETIEEHSESTDPEIFSKLIPLIDSLCLLNPTLSELESQYGAKLIQLARESDSNELFAYFLPKIESDFSYTILAICSIIFPIDHVRHPISVPALKRLEVLCGSENASIEELSLLERFLGGNKYSPIFFKLAQKLSPSPQVDILVSRVCSRFTREALDCVLRYYLPTLRLEAGEFVPLRMHLFKPVEVLSLEPAFHEDGTSWSGEHKEMRAAKKLEQEHKKDKRLTAKEMRREAIAHESLYAMEKKKEQEKSVATKKRSLAAMDQAENNFREMRTDNGKEPTLQMKRNKKSRKGGNKV